MVSTETQIYEETETQHLRTWKFRKRKGNYLDGVQHKYIWNKISKRIYNFLARLMRNDTSLPLLVKE